MLNFVRITTKIFLYLRSKLFEIFLLMRCTPRFLPPGSFKKNIPGVSGEVALY